MIRSHFNKLLSIIIISETNLALILLLSCSMQFCIEFLQAPCCLRKCPFWPYPNSYKYVIKMLSPNCLSARNTMHEHLGHLILSCPSLFTSILIFLNSKCYRYCGMEHIIYSASKRAAPGIILVHWLISQVVYYMHNFLLMYPSSCFSVNILLEAVNTPIF